MTHTQQRAAGSAPAQVGGYTQGVTSVVWAAMSWRWRGQARLGVARRCEAWRGKAWRVKGTECTHNDLALHGKAWLGKARRGVAGRCAAWLGVAWRGGARRGMARQGKGTEFNKETVR